MGSFRRYRDIIHRGAAAGGAVLLPARQHPPPGGRERRRPHPHAHRGAGRVRGRGARSRRLVASSATTSTWSTSRRTTTSSPTRTRDFARSCAGSRATEAENRRLGACSTCGKPSRAETVSAVVIGKDTTEYFRVAHLALDNPGAPVRSNMPVISFDGTVGTVLRVAGDRVDVRADRRQRLRRRRGGGAHRGARLRAWRWAIRARYAVRVEYVQRTDEVDVGDVLLTSGVGCRFPKGDPGRTRHQGRQARLRHLPERRSRADRRLLATRGGADRAQRHQGLRAEGAAQAVGPAARSSSGCATPHSSPPASF